MYVNQLCVSSVRLIRFQYNTLNIVVVIGWYAVSKETFL